MRDRGQANRCPRPISFAHSGCEVATPFVLGHTRMQQVESKLPGACSWSLVWQGLLHRLIFFVPREKSLPRRFCVLRDALFALAHQLRGMIHALLPAHVCLPLAIVEPHREEIVFGARVIAEHGLAERTLPPFLIG